MTELLRPDEIAPRMRVSRARIYLLISQGIIPSVRLGRSVRVPASAFESWMALQSRQALEGVGVQAHEVEAK